MTAAQFFSGPSGHFAPTCHWLEKAVMRRVPWSEDVWHCVMVDGEVAWRCQEEGDADAIINHLSHIGWGHRVE